MNYNDYPAPILENLWLNYGEKATEFKIWSPTAEKVQVQLYKAGNGGNPIATHQMDEHANGIWKKFINENLIGIYYTFQVLVNGSWLAETPGIYAQSVGVNGKRAMVLDLKTTNPKDWKLDHGPKIDYINEAIIYELHIRDMTIHPESGSSMPGKYLGLVEEGTKGPTGVATGINHLKEMGITHVHLLPAFDHYSINETKLDIPQFNWGYDPNNYNVPEGSFSSNPYKAEVRIKEFKEMVKSFHNNDIGVILDVVYNHTGRTENSNFNMETPGYYYRYWDDGKPSDAADCGNETASERAMMRKFIIESVVYWAQEYHIDGFRFDLMGIHDITTMNEITMALHNVNPNIFIYGEGWTAGDSPLEIEKRALKQNMMEMPKIAAFNDDIRDGLKGSVFDDASTGFISGAVDSEESVKMGIVGSIQHPQINYKSVNYSDAPWTNEPWQSISYVSCHDNHTIYDKLKVSRRDLSSDELAAMVKLGNAVVMTSQGTAFMHAGAEMLRTKNEEYNSYNLPDSINQINWNWKILNSDVVTYHKNLIALRKKHPGFRMVSANEVRSNLDFKTVEKGLISYQISNHANGDIWNTIFVAYNAKTEAGNYNLNGVWQIAVMGDTFYFEGGKKVDTSVEIPPFSMLVLFQK